MEIDRIKQNLKSPYLHHPVYLLWGAGRSPALRTQRLCGEASAFELVIV